jgi:CspA family cold shock protein
MGKLKRRGRISEKAKITNYMQGTIKTLTDRGFGFIARDGEAKDLFFHSKELNGVAFDDLKVGDVVTFEVVDGEKGPAAVNVSRA